MYRFCMNILDLDDFKEKYKKFIEDCMCKYPHGEFGEYHDGEAYFVSDLGMASTHEVDDETN